MPEALAAVDDFERFEVWTLILAAANVLTFALAAALATRLILAAFFALDAGLWGAFGLFVLSERGERRRQIAATSTVTPTSSGDSA